jgi:RNA polymerase sigma-70 factor (ECF subfamily)
VCDAEEQAWIRRCRDGDRLAFGPLAERYRGRAYHVALGLVHNADEALDVAQEALLAAFGAMRSFDPDRPFYPWLRTIVRNTALTRLRRCRREPVNGEALDAAAWTVTPEMVALQNEQTELLRLAMNRLPVADRQILFLKHFEDLKYRQIAQVLDVPIGTVMSRLYAARRRLRDLLEEGRP